MPSFRYYVCDRCSKRGEGRDNEFIGPGWSITDVGYGIADDRPDDTLPPEQDEYILCDECTPTALDGLRQWVKSTPARPN